jgi:hypothetical protein
MTVTTDVTQDQVVLTREGRRLLEARLDHLNRRVIPSCGRPWPTARRPADV